MDNKKTTEAADYNPVVAANQQDSAKNEAKGESTIERYDAINPEHTALEDMDEVQSTDDV